jgi:hypothetical protein
MGQMTTPKTIDYHHLDMSRDDGMDEHGIDWLCGCWMSSGRILAWKLGILQPIFVKP